MRPRKTAMFVGWDVGPWSCRPGGDRDATCVLGGESLEELELLDAPWCGDLQAYLRRCLSPEGRLGVSLGHDASEFVIAANAPFAWPHRFADALDGIRRPWFVPYDAEDPHAMLRQTELALLERGISSLPTRDWTGTQPCKAMYYLNTSGFKAMYEGVWRVGNYVALETWPGLAKTSPLLARHFARLRNHPVFGLRCYAGAAMADVEDALWCALVAATWSLCPELLAAPPESDPVVLREGWIWIPVDSAAGDGEQSGEAR